MLPVASQHRSAKPSRGARRNRPSTPQPNFLFPASATTYPRFPNPAKFVLPLSHARFLPGLLPSVQPNLSKESRRRQSSQSRSFSRSEDWLRSCKKPVRRKCPARKWSGRKDRRGRASPPRVPALHQKPPGPLKSITAFKLPRCSRALSHAGTLCVIAMIGGHDYLSGLNLRGGRGSLKSAGFVPRIQGIDVPLH